jgi:hypothetical protein
VFSTVAVDVATIVAVGWSGLQQRAGLIRMLRTADRSRITVMPGWYGGFIGMDKGCMRHKSCYFVIMKGAGGDATGPSSFPETSRNAAKPLMAAAVAAASALHALAVC